MKKKGVSPLRIIAVLFALCLLAVSGYTLADKLMEYRESKQVFDEMREAVKEDHDPNPTSLPEDEDADLSDEAIKASTVRLEGPVLRIDWSKFENGECVGWLLLDNISYPIMQANNNNKYLHALPDGTYNYGGSLFLYAENMAGMTDENSFIYGHNMANGSMFGKLKKYKSDEYRDHKFYIFTPDGYRHTYQFFSIASIEEGTRTYTYSFADKPTFLEYQHYMKQISQYKTGPKPNIFAHLCSLSTCDGFEGTSHRFVVQGIETEKVKIQKAASWWPETLKKSKERREEKKRLEELARKEEEERRKQEAIQRKEEERRLQEQQYYEETYTYDDGYYDEGTEEYYEDTYDDTYYESGSYNEI